MCDLKVSFNRGTTGRDKLVQVSDEQDCCEVSLNCSASYEVRVVLGSACPSPVNNSDHLAQLMQCLENSVIFPKEINLKFFSGLTELCKGRPVIADRIRHRHSVSL